MGRRGKACLITGVARGSIKNNSHDQDDNQADEVDKGLPSDQDQSGGTLLSVMNSFAYATSLTYDPLRQSLSQNSTGSVLVSRLAAHHPGLGSWDSPQS